MYVSNDINLYRGLIQGLPKQQASLWMTRSYPVANPAGAPLKAGTRVGATMSLRDRRLVEATLTLEESGAEPLGLASCPVLGIRYFPDLAQGSGGALAHDLVAFTGSGRVVAAVADRVEEHRRVLETGQSQVLPGKGWAGQIGRESVTPELLQPPTPGERQIGEEDIRVIEEIRRRRDQLALHVVRDRDEDRARELQ